MTHNLALPEGAYVLSDIAVPRASFGDQDGDCLRGPATDGLVSRDLGIVDGKFCAARELANAPKVDAGTWTLLPRLVDAHVHLDKTNSVAQTGLGDGTLLGAIEAFSRASAGWQAEYFRARMQSAVEGAVACGTAAMRSHIDCISLPNDTPAWRVGQILKHQLADKITLQYSALCSIDRVDEPSFELRCQQLAHTGDVLGTFIAPGFRDQAKIERFLRFADTHSLDVDFHIDENLIDSSPVVELLADAVKKTGYGGRVLAGHICAIVNAPENALDRILDKVALAGLSVVSLPRTNLYLQGRRPGATPRVRGISAIREMRARGIPVLIASDNVRDAFFPFGDYDMLRLLADASVSAHLDQDLPGWFAAISSAAGEALGLNGLGRIKYGGNADGILVPARNWPSLLMVQPSERQVLIAGRPCEQIEERQPLQAVGEL